MHARIARYTFSGDAQELARKAEAGLLPIFQLQPGFQGYSVVRCESEIISVSAWTSADDAEDANKAAASWVAENMADEVELKETLIGEILVSTALGISRTAGART